MFTWNPPPADIPLSSDNTNLWLNRAGTLTSEYLSELKFPDMLSSKSTEALIYMHPFQGLNYIIMVIVHVIKRGFVLRTDSVSWIDSILRHVGL